MVFVTGVLVVLWPCTMLPNSMALFFFRVSFVKGSVDYFLCFHLFQDGLPGLQNGPLIVFCHFSEVIVSPVDEYDCVRRDVG